MKYIILTLFAIPLYINVLAQPAIKAQTTFGGNMLDYFQSIDLTKDGGFIAVGFSYSGMSGDKTDTSRGEADYWIVKADAQGEKQWVKQLVVTWEIFYRV